RFGSPHPACQKQWYRRRPALPLWVREFHCKASRLASLFGDRERDQSRSCCLEGLHECRVEVRTTLLDSLPGAPGKDRRRAENCDRRKPDCKPSQHALLSRARLFHLIRFPVRLLHASSDAFFHNHFKSITSKKSLQPQSTEPPFTFKTSPVMWRAHSLQRKIIGHAMSSAVAIRPIGIARSIWLRASGSASGSPLSSVSTQPGATALTLIPWPPSSVERALVNEI